MNNMVKSTQIQQELGELQVNQGELDKQKESQKNARAEQKRFWQEQLQVTST